MRLFLQNYPSNHRGPGLPASPVSISLTVLLFLSICLYGPSTGFAEPLEGPSDDAKAPITVTVKPLSSLQFYPEREAPARVVNLNQGPLTALVDAPLQTLLVEVGDRLQPGQVVARLDCQMIALDRAQLLAQQKIQQTQLAFARRELQRAKTLRASNNLGEAELDRKATDVKRIEQELGLTKVGIAQAEVRVSRCEIRSPFAAVVTQRIANEGVLVSRGQPIVEVAQLKPIYVHAEIPVKLTDAFSQAKAYYFSHQSQRFSLVLDELLPVADPTQRSVVARLRFKADSDDSVTLPRIGINGQVVWSVAAAHLPGYLLQQRNGQYGVFYFDAEASQQRGVSRFHPVAEAQEGRPFVVEGLPEVPIIIDGRFSLEVNSTVTLSGAP